MSKSITTRRRRVCLLGGVSLLTLLCSGAAAEPLLPAIDIGGQQTPDSGASSPPPRSAQNAQPAAGPAQPAPQPLGDWPGASNATPTLFDGSAAAGYRLKDSTAAGPIWGDLPLQDTPYSVSVVPSSLIENLQAYQPENLVQVLPQVTNVLTQQNSSGNPFLYVRGFSITQFTNNAGVTYDGMLGGAGGMFTNVLEDKERVELLAGADGFLYGTNSVGGNLNYVLKRPTATTYNSITAGDNAGANGFVHGDFGGPLIIPGLKDDLFGYRVNLVYQGGDTSILDQDIKRNLLSAAFDIRPTENILLQLNAEHAYYHVYGETPGFSSSLSPYPAPANPAQLPATPFQFATTNDVVGAKLTWKLNDMFTLRSQWSYTDEQRQYWGSGDNFSSLINYQGLVKQTISDSWQLNNWYTSSGYAFLDTKVSTFGIDHKITAGFTGFQQMENINPVVSQALFTYSQNANFYNLNQVPTFPYGYSWTSGHIGYIYFGKNFVIGDEIKVTDKFTILAGANYTTLGNNNYNAEASLSKAYGAGAVTPSVSALYKVLPWFTVYASYQQSLQQGVEVISSASTVYTNNGQVLPPYLSYQEEVGIKMTVGKNMLVTAALFDINKSNIYVQNNYNGTYTYDEGGREDHKGIELTTSGKATEDLTIVSGLTLLNPRINQNPTSPWQNGQLAQDVSPISGKIYAEYTIPYMASLPYMRGLTLIGGIQYNGPFSGSLPTSYATIPTIQKFPGYSVGSLGLRYTIKVYDREVTFRFNVNNLTNTAYWSVPGFEGAPRTFLASMQVKF